MSFPYQTNPVTSDVALSLSKALPAAGASNASDSFDLGQATAFPINTKLALKVSIPATPNLTDAKSITVAVKDSADGQSFDTVPELASIVITGAGGAGAAAVSRTFPLPGTLRRHVRFESAVDAGGGDNTAVKVTAELLTLI